MLSLFLLPYSAGIITDNSIINGYKHRKTYYCDLLKCSRRQREVVLLLVKKGRFY